MDDPTGPDDPGDDSAAPASDAASDDSAAPASDAPGDDSAAPASDTPGDGATEPPPDAPEPVAPDTERLLLDAMLGKLTTYLRMCGYDAAYALDRGVEADDAVLELAAREERRLVTRDERLAASATDGVLLTARDVEEQLRELAAAGFELSLGTPSRCSRCNAPLERISPDATVPDYVPDDATPVWRCSACGQYFWRGTHWADVRRRLSSL